MYHEKGSFLIARALVSTLNLLCSIWMPGYIKVHEALLPLFSTLNFSLHGRCKKAQGRKVQEERKMVRISPLLFVSDAADGHKFIACVQTSLYFLCCTRKSDICFYAIASRVSVFRCVAYSIFHTTKSPLVSTVHLVWMKTTWGFQRAHFLSSKRLLRNR